MAFKKKVDTTEIVEKEIEVKVEKQLEEKRDFSIIERETKQLKIIKKSEYNPEKHIAL